MLFHLVSETYCVSIDQNYFQVFDKGMDFLLRTLDFNLLSIHPRPLSQDQPDESQPWMCLTDCTPNYFSSVISR